MRPQKLLIGILLLVSIAGNAILYFKYRNRRPIITVNGSTITYKDLVDYLQLKEGVQVKAQLVERVLIKQEAEKLKCWPTEAEVTEEYNHQKMMDWQFARDVTNAPWQEGEKKDIIRYNFARHALMTKGVQISEEQLKDEYNLAKPIYDTPTMIKCNMGILFRSAPVEEVKKMLEKKNPVVSPQDIQRNFSSQMMFIGDNQLSVRSFLE